MARIILSNRFYERSAIEEALRDFSEICDGKIIGERFEIELLPKTKDIAHLEREFANYVLGLMKNRMIV